MMDTANALRCHGIGQGKETAPLERVDEKEKIMKKSWTKPSMCQVAAGMEISRYLPAEITPKK